MYRKGPFTAILVLIVAAFACNSSPDLPDHTVPDAVRNQGECSDPRFKEAELEAFQAMLEARAAATDAFERRITEIEQEYKQLLLKNRSDYNKTLNGCKDAKCSQDAKTDYDKYIESAQVSQEAQIDIAEDAEQTAIEAAQDAYNEAVEQARQEYCVLKYLANGTQEEATYQGLICDLEQPFIVMVSSPYYAFAMQFTPSGSQAGTFSYAGGWFDVGPVNGNGTYTLQGVGTENIKLIGTAAHTTSTEIGDVHGPPQYNFDLIRIDTDECSQP
jgi:hypothetical protein